MKNSKILPVAALTVLFIGYSSTSLAGDCRPLSTYKVSCHGTQTCSISVCKNSTVNFLPMYVKPECDKNLSAIHVKGGSHTTCGSNDDGTYNCEVAPTHHLHVDITCG